jgi:hypothetical protein
MDQQEQTSIHGSATHTLAALHEKTGPHMQLQQGASSVQGS